MSKQAWERQVWELQGEQCSIPTRPGLLLYLCFCVLQLLLLLCCTHGIMLLLLLCSAVGSCARGSRGGDGCSYGSTNW
jgi:hypothetical protein